MNTNEYIEYNLKRINDIDTFEKFDFLFSTVNAIYLEDISKNEIIENVLNEINALRYEMAYNKGIESISSRLDKVLAYESLKLARIVYRGTNLLKFINDVLYYEINEGIIIQLKNEVKLISENNFS